jgi:hypothetical protein
MTNPKNPTGKSLTPEDKQRIDKALALISKYNITKGLMVVDQDGTGEFNYMGALGHLIFCKPGCPNMQDSWAMLPENAEKAYFS